MKIWRTIFNLGQPFISFHSISTGWIFWDDENQEDIDGGNSVTGYTPEGVYELDTLMYFCCNDKGNVSLPIDLPLNNPFYLMPFKTKECQKVNHIKNVYSEFIHWDDEDRGNRNAHSKYTPYGLELDAWDTMINYCYYDTGKQRCLFHSQSTTLFY